MSSLKRSTRKIAPVWWLNVAIAAGAVLLFLGPVDNYKPIAHPHIAWWWLAIAFGVAERCVVHLQFRRSAHSFSLGDLPVVFGLLFASPHDLVLAGLVGTGATLVIDRRLPLIKLAFNLAQLALAITLEAFRAEMAEIVLFGSEGTPPLRTTLGPGDRKEIMQPVEPEIADELRGIVNEERPAAM